MATTEPLSGVTVYQQSDQALGGQQMGTVVTQLGPLLNLRYATTGARDTAFNNWIAAGTGRSIPNGASAFVGSRQYVYDAGSWVARSFYRGTGSTLPSDGLAGDTYYHTTYRCMMAIRNGTWRQQDMALVTSDSDRSSFVSALNTAGLSLHEGFQVYQTDTDVLFVGTGSGATLNRVSPPGFLTQNTGANSTSGATNTVSVTATVTVPDALPSNRRVKVTGTTGVTTPGGVGGVIVVGTGTASTTRTVSTSLDGDISAIFYDADLTAGSRTYTMWTRATVSQQTINIWSPTLSVEII